MSKEKPTTPPSKQDLLNELESIRTFLSDDEAAAIPTLTVVAEQPVKPAGEESSEDDTGPTVDDAVRADIDQHTLDTKHNRDANDGSVPKAPDTAADQQALPEGDLSLQSSLFDEPDYSDDTNETHRDQKDHKAATKANTSSFNDMPKAQGENPFLPPHIRERLGKHKELFESVPEEMVATLQKRAHDERQEELLREIANDAAASHNDTNHQEPQATNSAADAPSHRSAHEKEALIDELVAEYLPLLEEKLRIKLRASTWKDDK